MPRAETERAPGSGRPTKRDRRRYDAGQIDILVRRSERFVLVSDPLKARDENRQKPGDGAQQHVIPNGHEFSLPLIGLVP